jgi:organic radical activating enzyme
VSEEQPWPAKPGHLRVVEQYLCTEGEGLTLGAATWLIRLAGCDLRCWWCDSKHAAFTQARGRELACPGLLAKALASGAAWVSFTGGEPTWRSATELKALAGLCRGLRMHGLKVKLETNGLRLPAALKGCVDLWSVAPKWDARPQASARMRHDVAVLKRLCGLGPGRTQLKFVIPARRDGSPEPRDLARAARLLKALGPLARRVPIFFTPEGGLPGAPYLERNRALAAALRKRARAWRAYDLRATPQWHRVLHGDARLV